MIEPLKVDTDGLDAASAILKSAAGQIPTQLPQFSVNGSDPLSAAIAAGSAQIEAPMAALPWIKAEATTTAEKIGVAGQRYRETDETLAQKAKEQQFPTDGSKPPQMGVDKPMKTFGPVKDAPASDDRKVEQPPSGPAAPLTDPQSPPMRPGEPIDPKNGRIGDPRFGHWEDVTLPNKPWVGDTPPPLTTEERPFPEDVRDALTAKPTEYFVPNKSWAFDNEAPYLQLQEQYRVRISGSEATPYTRVIDSAAGPTQQRWVQYTYEVAHSRQVSLGGDVQVKGKSGDIAGLGPYRWLSEDWTPTSIADIAKLSATNPKIDFHIPDGCGGQFTLQNAVPVGPLPIGVPPSPPIMTRPS